MTFWGGSGSGSADPCLWLFWPSRCQQKTNFLTQYFLIITYFLKLHLHHFSKIKSQESQNSRSQGFSYYFCMMIEGSGSRAGSGSGSIPVTSGCGSGSRRPKNKWIRWIRIRNTGNRHTTSHSRHYNDHLTDILGEFDSFLTNISLFTYSLKRLDSDP